MDWLIKLASKVSGSVFLVALIIFVAFVIYLIRIIFKYRKDIKDAIELWTKREQEREDIKKATIDNAEAIKALQQKNEEFCYNRIHDREQSFEIQKKLTESMEKLADAIGRIEEFNSVKEKQLDNLIESQKEILAEKINEKYKYYLSIDGIPEDEYDEFVSLHEAYKSTGGNHHGDAKFNYCIKHLKVIPVITELKITAERVNEMTSKLID
jgi:hypothetical protein